MATVLSKALLAASAAALLAGCTGVRSHKGHVLDQQLVAGIQPGVDNKDSVARTLGRPTLTGQFNDNEWIYVSRDTRAFAFRRPRPVDQTALIIRFDPAGNVTQIERSGMEKVAFIDPVGGKTPTLGRQRSFFEELFGNIGVMGSGMGGAGRPAQ